MSKSIGNLIFPHDFLKKYDADTYKLLILTTNFAKPINLTDELLDSIQTIINKFNLLNNTIQLKKIENEIDERKVKEVIEEIANLNFSNAYKEIIQLTKKEDQYKTFLEIMKILGFIFPLKIISQEDKNLYNQW
ncbi:Cysteine--tRNA ligase, partial [Metamycoplasma alkalescens]